MSNQIFLQNSLDEELQNPKTTLETILKNDSFLLWLKNSSTQPNLIDFLCKDDNPYIILKYALLDSVNMDDFKTIHLCCKTILTSSYFNDRSLRARFLKNPKFIQYLVDFSESELLHNYLVCANYAKIIELIICNLSKLSNENKLIQDNFGFLQNFLIKNINILSFRELLIKLTLSFPDQINRNEEMFINMIQLNLSNSNKLFFSLQTIIHFLREKPSLDLLLDNERFGKIILKIAIDNYETHPLTSANSFEIFQNIKEKSNKLNFQNIIIDTEITLTSLNLATASALSLFPNNVENFILPFFEFKCNTFLNDRIVSIFRSLKKNEMIDIVTRYHINNLIIQSYPKYLSLKTNGHFFELSKLISDSKIICCSEHETDWNLFILQKLNSRKQQVNKKTEIKISNEKKFFHFSMLKQNIRPRK